MNDILWKPDETSIGATNIVRFMQELNRKKGLEISDYEQLYQWSIESKEDFWSELWDFAEVVGDKGNKVLINGDQIEAAEWFPEARLNFAENLLRKRSNDIAIYFRAENLAEYSLTWNELYAQVSSVAFWLRQQGLNSGDRVAAYMPNLPETVIAMLATTSIGAVWTSISPDFGEESVVDRFGQTEPRFLFTVDGYFYNGRKIDIRSKVKSVLEQLPSIEQAVQLNFAGFGFSENTVYWQDIAFNQASEIEFTPCSFNDPLYILYSSGTTGKPKCITHKVGGVLLQHMKEQLLHSDIRSGDRVFYFTTCGWMMWNWLVSALAVRASLVLYDGSPFAPDGNILWDYAEETGATLFGTSAKYIEALKQGDITPMTSHKLPALRTICSTGSVLSAECFDYVYASIKQDVCLSSISGGTDIVSCFVIGCPILPVRRNESQCRGLGMAVDVFDDDGNSIRNQKGELVCTQPFPSQPLCFWGDESGEKYHEAYFAKYENCWHQGDYVSLSANGGMSFYGRSDTVLNPGGVRIGTAEIYRHVEQIEEIVESVVVGQDWDNDVRVVLFVVLRPEITLDEELILKIKKTIRSKCTSRHVPAKVIKVTDIPRTRSGKLVELAVRDAIHNREIKNIGALLNPEALEYYRNIPELQN